MNREGNTYTILYAAIMVVLVAVALALTSQLLKNFKQENVRVDKMEQILRSLNIVVSNKTEVAKTYRAIIKKELLVNEKGEVVSSFEGNDLAANNAFNMNTANQFKSISSGSEYILPLYVAEVDGNQKFVLPMNGNGLWGAIWGYLALDADANTIFGSDFGHAGETPGLGAEIATEHFAKSFVGKHIANASGQVIGVAVVKGGKFVDEREFVDGISGGTLTSNGVDEMISYCLKQYTPYLTKSANQE
ncbi:Na(+)-translocating NADH-quinone reductase subunit C [Porphyromonas gingivicanis]|uniref:Na(+)-translocating NADH-quinone reductase subunit C n=1 Tax=Porphyromonas gingivicanis TaxID=266762 RepID=A0A0A2GAD2_9PORP|nr:NADH:ubiquinone reductase (Na(+)-transporting) subunit C [Porphyromonas gingivicanis]KGN97394.1 Na(+)-translocating NADH-quinone reductase subunit C [Porphyromonas gingivicanis]